MEFGATEGTGKKRYCNIIQGTILVSSDRDVENKDEVFRIICASVKFERHTSPT
jgi:hypothetical protein